MYQIGIIGSCSDLKYGKKASEFAAQMGRLLADNNSLLVYGAEKDINSLPTEAASACIQAGGKTMGVTYEGKGDLYNQSAASYVVRSGLVRGGGRELTLMLSCDAVIAISGGSGTLTEAAIAYQANIPVITVPLFEGWSSKLNNTYLDDRKRYAFEEVTTPDEAVKRALELATKYQKQDNESYV